MADCSKACLRDTDERDYEATDLCLKRCSERKYEIVKENRTNYTNQISTVGNPQGFDIVRYKVVGAAKGLWDALGDVKLSN